MNRACFGELQTELDDFKYQIYTQNKKHDGCTDVVKNAPWTTLA